LKVLEVASEDAGGELRFPPDLIERYLDDLRYTDLAGDLHNFGIVLAEHEGLPVQQAAEQLAIRVV